MGKTGTSLFESGDQKPKASDVTVRRTEDGKEVRKAITDTDRRTEVLEATIQAAKDELKEIEVEGMKEALGALTEETIVFLESRTNRVIGADDLNRKRVGELCAKLLSHGARNRVPGQNKAAMKTASDIIAAVGGKDAKTS